MTAPLTTAPAQRDAFSARYSFGFDDFQSDALDAIDRRDHVIVAAPTGSGKTVIAEYAVAQALASAGRVFYTAPIKALSNQKYLDLCALYGQSTVGLLTGDNSVNDSAPVVVMTTEVLRNMIYARADLSRLLFVVLDEVHFLQDTYRGPVWEEVIIHLPAHVRLVCLSATVSNAGELGDWVTSVRGSTTVITHAQRPVDLVPWWIAFDRERNELREFPVFVDGRANRAAAAYDAESLRNKARPGFRQRRTRALAIPGRQDVVHHLRLDERLPAIYFIFSRAGCADAVRSCLRSGVRLTSEEERDEIRSLLATRLATLSTDDRRILGEAEFTLAMEAGVAAHHAGMVPVFKEAVEAAFVRGLVKVVFATETLAVGINMPARSVVIEKLSKFSGDGHDVLTPGEFTQLTGRAGRRGIDPVGHAITLWSPFVRFEQVAQLASSRSFELRSAFRPTYNMAVNLVRRYSSLQAREVLSKSFAQFRIDAELQAIENRRERMRAELAELVVQARCERGNVTEYSELLEAAKQHRSVRDPVGEIATVFENLRPGAVIDADGAALAVVSTSGRRGRDITIRALTMAGRMISLTPDDLDRRPEAVAHIALPTPFNPTSTAFRQAATGSLRKAVARLERKQRSSSQVENGDEEDRRSQTGRTSPFDAVENHPVHGCPELDHHLRALGGIARTRRSLDRLNEGRRQWVASLSDQLDSVLRVLEDRHYVNIPGWKVTSAGLSLASLYHECDLLVCECLREGVFDGLQPHHLAALASVFIYERRGPSRGPQPDSVEGEPPDDFPKQLRSRWQTVARIARRLNFDEGRAHLPLTRTPDPGFAGPISQWANGEALDQVLDSDDDLTGGDFVRTTRLLVDLLRQIANIAPDPKTSTTARRAADHILRGVVASTTVGAGPELDPSRDRAATELDLDRTFAPNLDADFEPDLDADFEPDFDLELTTESGSEIRLETNWPVSEPDWPKTEADWPEP